MSHSRIEIGTKAMIRSEHVGEYEFVLDSKSDTVYSLEIKNHIMEEMIVIKATEASKGVCVGDTLCAETGFDLFNKVATVLTPKSLTQKQIVNIDALAFHTQRKHYTGLHVVQRLMDILGGTDNHKLT